MWADHADATRTDRPDAAWANGSDATWAARPDAMWADGPAPSGDTPTTMLGGLRPTRDPGGPRRPRRPLLIGVAAAALVAIVAGIVLVQALSGEPLVWNLHVWPSMLEAHDELGERGHRQPRRTQVG